MRNYVLSLSNNDQRTIPSFLSQNDKMDLFQ